MVSIMVSDAYTITDTDLIPPKMADTDIRVINAPINVMPDYHRYRLRWGQVGISILENYNSPPTGEARAVQSPTPT